jgi:hypothetical protein
MYVLAPQATTGCSAASRIDTGGFPIKGVIEANQTSSFYQIASLDPTHTSDAYVTASAASSPDKQVASTPNFLSYGCTQSKFQNLTALQSIPSMDANGYNLGPNTETGNPGYQYSSYSGQCCSTPNIYTAPNQWLAYPSPATPINTGYPNQYGAAYQWQLAAWDAVDNVASAIRSDANHTARGEVLNPDGTPPMGVTIFTVGYTGDGGTDAGLLSKVANVAGCSFNSMSCVVATGPNGAKEGNGKYIEATTTTELTTAFSTLMSTILRLSQ